MGRITIDIPQHRNFDFRIVEKETAEAALLKLRELIDRANAIDPGEVSEIWADCGSSAAEIALGLRQSWRRKLSNGCIFS
jgi:hypothetical protein